MALSINDTPPKLQSALTATSVAVLTAIMWSDIMLSVTFFVVILSVPMPSVGAPYSTLKKYIS